MVLLLLLLEFAGRVSTVAALLTVSRSSQAAAAIAIGAALVGAARSIAKASAVGRETERAWRELSAGITRTELATLLAERGEAQHVAMLVDSAREVALYRATSFAEIAADGLALAAVAGYAMVKLPVYMSAFAAGGLVVAALITRFARRAQHRTQKEAFGEFALVARDMEALVEAGLELRANAAERPHVARLLSAVARMAAAERRSLRWSAASSALPSVLALALVLTPPDVVRSLGERVGWLDLGVVGATGLALTASLARGVDALARSASHRALFERIAARAKTVAAPFVERGSLTSIGMRGVSIRRGASERATPSGLTFELEAGGVVLVGDNGVGKTSTLLALLGLLPCDGDVRANGAPTQDFEWLRSRVAFVPQRSFVAPGESLRFHALLAGVEDESALRRACERVGLGAVLARAGLDAPMGALSGGERQRFFLARALARQADVLLLDEPEAGLDAAQRVRLCEILSEESKVRRLLLVAHDPTVIPEGFGRISCTAT